MNIAIISQGKVKIIFALDPLMFELGLRLRGSLTSWMNLKKDINIYFLVLMIYHN